MMVRFINYEDSNDLGEVYSLPAAPQVNDEIVLPGIVARVVLVTWRMSELGFERLDVLYRK